MIDGPIRAMLLLPNWSRFKGEILLIFLKKTVLCWTLSRANYCASGVLRELPWKNRAFFWLSTGGTLAVYWNLEFYMVRCSSTSIIRWHKKIFGGPKIEMRKGSKTQKKWYFFNLIFHESFLWEPLFNLIILTINIFDI